MIYIINLRDVARPSTTLQSQLAPAKMELLLQVDASTVRRLRHSGRSTEATAWAPTMWGIRIRPLLLLLSLLLLLDLSLLDPQYSPANFPVIFIAAFFRVQSGGTYLLLLGRGLRDGRRWRAHLKCGGLENCHMYIIS